MIYDAMDVVVVPFPFADRDIVKLRPALVLSGYESFGKMTGVANLAMITAATNSGWPFDVRITDLIGSGLQKPCSVRLKFTAMTFDRIVRKLGRLGVEDARDVTGAIKAMIASTGRNDT